MSAKFYVGNNITDFSDNGKMRPVSRVTLEVDDDHIITAGDDTGLTLTAKCPYATQELVNKLLEQVKGYRYQAYTADAANIDPVAELGDGVTAGGVYGFISRVDDDGSGYPSLESPGEEELQDEFPAEGPMMQGINAQFANTKATITKTADEIRLEVQKGDEANKSLIDQNAAAIELRVEKDHVVSSINQSAEEIKINANKISLEGLVTVNGTFQIDEDGYLRCNGGTIGGFTIGSSALYNGMASYDSKSNGVYVGTNGIALGGGKFKVSSGGQLHAEGADISGTISATSGTFNNVTITGSTFGGTLNSPNGSISGVSGSYVGSINSGGTFTGTHSGGSLYSTGGSFTGTNSGTLTGRASSATLSSCSLGGTSLATGGGGSFSSYSSGGAGIYGSLVQISAGGTYTNISSGNFAINSSCRVTGSLTVDGSKDRIIHTNNFGQRCLDAYESPNPTFSDFGVARLDDNGVCYIWIDPIFAEAVNKYYRPTVFLTPYGIGHVYVADIKHDVITVNGEPGISFSWETRYQQGKCEQRRLREYEFESGIEKENHNFDLESNVDLEHTAPNMEFLADEYLNLYAATATDYGAEGASYYTEFERSLTA